MENKLQGRDYLTVGSMLFGLFFGAGNLIFPVHMGQLAGNQTLAATLGFIVTGVGLPFLGVLAIGISRGGGLYDVASRVHPYYGLFLTVALYLTIGPFFALPRTATVPFEIAFAGNLAPKLHTGALALFTLCFFLLAIFFALRPTKLMVWIGKVLNPLFLIFLAILILQVFIQPFGSLATTKVTETYQLFPFSTGFLEGYNTMDALASLAFGILVVDALKQLNVKKPSAIARATFKSGIVTVILMALIYGCLAYIGAISTHAFHLSANGGIALAQIAHYYFGTGGSILLALIVSLACLKTAIGLIVSCSETFQRLFPTLSYRTYVLGFGVIGCLIANFGLSSIIAFSLPVLMFLYPLAITLILLIFLAPLFQHRQIVYQVTTLFTGLVALLEGLRASSLSATAWGQQLLQWCYNWLPFANNGMGWIAPAACGFLLGIVLSIFYKTPAPFTQPTKKASS